MTALTKFAVIKLPSKVAILVTLMVCGTAIGQDPTPRLSHAVDFGKDKTSWNLDYVGGNTRTRVAEWVPDGQSVESWVEMVACQVSFTDQTLADYVESWKSLMSRSAADIEMQEVADDDTITIMYSSEAFQEISIRRFVKAEDGIYAFAYHARPRTASKQRLALWAKIIARASLVPNPTLKN